MMVFLSPSNIFKSKQLIALNLIEVISTPYCPDLYLLLERSVEKIFEKAGVKRPVSKEFVYK